MTMRSSQVIATAAGAAGALVLGCGLISGSLTTITFGIPKKMYSLDTTDGQRWKTPPGGIPAQPCGAGTPIADCCAPAPGVTVDCQSYPLACEAGTCTLGLRVEIPQSINLGMEAPEFKRVEGQSVAAIHLKAIHYDVVNNLNVDVPPIDIFLAPSDATSSTHPGARKLGTVPLLPAGMSSRGDVVLVSGAKEIFASFARSYTVPFTVIAATTVKVKGGTTPAGRLDMTIDGEAQVEFTLASVTD